MTTGFKLIYVGELIRTPYAYDHKGIIQGLSILKNDGIISDFKIVDPVLYPDMVVNECNSFNADLVIHGNTDSLGYHWPQDIKCGLQCFFMGDCQATKAEYSNWNTWIDNGAGYFDALFISNRPQLNMWSEEFKAPAYFWPHGCFVPEKLEKGNEYHELLFIGTVASGGFQQARYDLLMRINDLHIVDFLTGSGVEGRNDVWFRMDKLYHTAKFVLDVSHFWDIDGYASGRYWYSGGLGACTLTKRFPSCEEFYVDKKEKLYFDTPEEAIDLFKFYSTRLEDIEQIKYNAYERNKRDHNYIVRFKEMFRILSLIG